MSSYIRMNNYFRRFLSTGAGVVLGLSSMVGDGDARRREPEIMNHLDNLSPMELEGLPPAEVPFTSASFQKTDQICKETQRLAVKAFAENPSEKNFNDGIQTQCSHLKKTVTLIEVSIKMCTPLTLSLPLFFDDSILKRRKEIEQQLIFYRRMAASQSMELTRCTYSPIAHKVKPKRRIVKVVKPHFMELDW